jgi:hypothetical protein
MRDLTCTGFRAALFMTGAWIFATLWTGGAMTGERGLMAGAATATVWAVPVVLGWAAAWGLSQRRPARHPAEGHRRPARPMGRRRTARELTGTGRGVPRALALMIGLKAALVVAGEAGLVHLAGFRALAPLDAAGDAARLAPRAAAALDDARRLAALVGIVLFTAFTLVFLVAAGLLRQELEGKGVRGFRWTWRWTAVTLFIPVLNLVRPWLGLAEIDRAVTGSVTAGRLGDDWRRDGGFSLPTAVLAIAWLARFGAATATTAEAGSLTQAAADPAAWQAAIDAVVGGASTGLGVDLAVMGVMVWWIWRLHGRVQRI